MHIFMYMYKYMRTYSLPLQRLRRIQHNSLQRTGPALRVSHKVALYKLIVYASVYTRDARTSPRGVIPVNGNQSYCASRDDCDLGRWKNLFTPFPATTSNHLLTRPPASP